MEKKIIRLTENQTVDMVKKIANSILKEDIGDKKRSSGNKIIDSVSLGLSTMAGYTYLVKYIKDGQIYYIVTDVYNGDGNPSEEIQEMEKYSSPLKPEQINKLKNFFN